jgi:hypothetical protein
MHGLPALPAGLSGVLMRGSSVGGGGGPAGGAPPPSRGCVRVNDTEEAARATTAQGQVQEARVCLWMWMGQPN